MDADWDFYFLLVEDKPASIAVDLSLAAKAPIIAQPHMAYVRVYMRLPNAEGLSSNEEFDTLGAIEDALEPALCGDGLTTYAGRNTCDGTRDFYFYTSDPARLEQAAANVLHRFPDYEIDTGSRPDPDWDVYCGFLYPSPANRQIMLNRRLVAQLKKHGDRTEEAREIDHFAYFPDEDSAQAMAAELTQKDFAVDPVDRRDHDFGVQFHRVDSPDSLDDVVVPLALRIAELGGSYDGWGCGVVN
jgi:uncharacterized protein (TIGR01619 family)